MKKKDISFGKISSIVTKKESAWRNIGKNNGPGGKKLAYERGLAAAIRADGH